MTVRAALLNSAARRRLAFIAGAVLVMAVGIAIVESRIGRSDPAHMRMVDDLDTGAPIASEADVFRLQPSDLAVDAMTASGRPTRARTLAGFRDLRAFPGAPPRIPHTLSPDEFRGTTCNTCHERGGWSERFAAYTPVTPHPEFRGCLQCHVADDGNVGVTSGTAARPAAGAFVPHDWRTTAWPTVGQLAMEGSPPAIPHTLELRGNCLACHAGPGAVAEIRTTHPERAGCRQCHVLAYPVDDRFTRPVRTGAPPAGGR